MIRLISAHIHDRYDISILVFLDPFDFLVPAIGRFDGTDIKLEISAHELETGRGEIVVMG